MQCRLTRRDPAFLVFNLHSLALYPTGFDLAAEIQATLAYSREYIRREHLRRHTEQEYAEQQYQRDREYQRTGKAEAAQQQISDKPADDSAADVIDSVLI